MATCTICNMTYAEDFPDDVKRHKAEHSKLAAGLLPRNVREFMKGFGWAVAHDDRSLDTKKGDYDRELGKLAVAFSWWHRALGAGASKKDFDRFMKAHLAYAEFLVSGAGGSAAELGIKEWEKFHG